MQRCSPVVNHVSLLAARSPPPIPEQWHHVAVLLDAHSEQVHFSARHDYASHDGISAS